MYPGSFYKDGKWDTHPAIEDPATKSEVALQRDEDEEDGEPYSEAA